MRQPDQIDDILAYYDRDAEREQSRLDRHQIEFEITMRHLRNHLPATGEILEVGCAAGRYTIPLAQLGYRVTAVDMVPRLHEEVGLQTILVASSDPGNTAVDEVIGDLPEHQRELWLDLLYRISVEPSYRGAWCHMLYLGRKR